MEYIQQLGEREKFPSCFKIEWNIENFCLLLRRNSQKIQSAEFSLRLTEFDTKWMLTIELEIYDQNTTSTMRQLSFRLRRLQNGSPEKIMVLWEATITAPSKKVYSISERKILMAEGSVDCGLKTGIYIDDIFPSLKTDTFSVECNVLFPCFTKQFDTFKRTSSGGLQCLSEDLQQLRNGKLSDIVLEVENKTINAHKAILCRNQVLKDYIEKAKAGTIRLPNLKYEAVSEFVAFLYSGDLISILSKSSFALMRCIEHFKSDALQPFFMAAGLKMLTTVHTQTHVFCWTLKELSNNYVVSSPPIKRIDWNTIWGLTLRTDNNGTISVKALVLEGNIPDYFTLEFGVLNYKKEILCRKKVISFGNPHENMEISNFTTRQALLHLLCVIDERVTVFFKIRISDGIQKSTELSRMIPFAISPCASTYEQLSSEMAKVLKEETYSDIIIKCNSGAEFKAHKCVLAARSSRFSKIIEEMPSETILHEEYLDPEILEVILKYIYSGVLQKGFSSWDPKINSAFVIYDIHSLKEDLMTLKRTYPSKRPDSPIPY